MPPTTITSARLELTLLELSQLRALLTDAPGATPFADPHAFLASDPDLLARRLAQEEHDPAVGGWLLRAALLRTTGEVIGRVNFHDRPDAEGMVEIGYTVHPLFRRQGYGRELALAMWDWAASREDVLTLRASISPDNVASRAIVAGAGFRQTGSQIDPEDGLELVYEVSAAVFHDRFRDRH